MNQVCLVLARMMAVRWLPRRAVAVLVVLAMVVEVLVLAERRR